MTAADAWQVAAIALYALMHTPSFPFLALLLSVLAPLLLIGATIWAFGKASRYWSER